MAAGDYSASALPDILLKIDELFADPRSARELQHPLESAKAVLENQMVRFIPTMLGDKCTGVNAAWLKSCADTSVGCDGDDLLSDCEITGDELESDSKAFPDNFCYRDRFAVMDIDCKDKFEFDEKMAYGFATKTLQLEKNLNNAIITFLGANASANLYTNTLGTIQVGGETDYKPEQYVPETLFADLDLTAIFNEINNPILLSGTLMRNAFYNAGFNNLNMDQKDQKAQFDAWNLYFDPRSVDSVAGEQAMYMFDAGAMAFWCKNEFTNLAPNNQMDPANTHTFALPSRHLMYRDGNAMKKVMFDVYTQRKCVISNGLRKWGTHVEIQLRGGLHLGPLDCNSGSGILEFGVDLS